MEPEDTVEEDHGLGGPSSPLVVGRRGEGEIGAAVKARGERGRRKVNLGEKAEAGAGGHGHPAVTSVDVADAVCLCAAEEAGADDVVGVDPATAFGWERVE